jgi:hypothetical protein
MICMRKFLTISAFTLLATALHAQATALLRNGFSISHDHRQQLGAITRLFLGASDTEYVDVPTDSIAGFEKEDIAATKLVPLAVAGGSGESCKEAELHPSATPDAIDPLHAIASANAPLPCALSLDEVVDNAAQANQLDADFLRAVIRAESNGKANAVSPKGAQGLMQLMPQTAARLGVKNSFDPGENVGAGTKYLRQLLEQYHNDPVRALAAYNAGAGRVQQYNGIPPYKETRAYVSSIIRDFNRRKMEQARAVKDSKKSAHASAAHRPPNGD